MNILLEGSDATFKTTVAEKLSKRLGMDVIKGSSFEMSQCSNRELFDKFQEIHSQENVIIDRSVFSNYVYGTIYNKTILTDAQREVIEEQFRKNTLTVYLHADAKDIQERINIRGDEDIKGDMIPSILYLYELILEESSQNNVPMMKFNTSSVSSDSVVETLALLMDNIKGG